MSKEFAVCKKIKKKFSMILNVLFKKSCKQFFKFYLIRKIKSLKVLEFDKLLPYRVRILQSYFHPAVYIAVSKSGPYLAIFISLLKKTCNSLIQPHFDYPCISWSLYLLQKYGRKYSLSRDFSIHGFL